MATRNKRKLAALNKENCEEHPRSNLVQNSNVPRSQEDYITQVSEEIEGRVTKKLSQEFSRTENRILGALARLDDFLRNPLLQGHSGTTPETSRNVFSINQGTNEDDSQSNPHPEAGLLTSGREDRHDMATGVQRQSVDGCDTSFSVMGHSAAWKWINWTSIEPLALYDDLHTFLDSVSDYERETLTIEHFCKLRTTLLEPPESICQFVQRPFCQKDSKHLT